MDGTLLQSPNHASVAHNFCSINLHLAKPMVAATIEIEIWWGVVAIITLFIAISYRQRIEAFLALLGDTATGLSNEYNRGYLEENEKEE